MKDKNQSISNTSKQYNNMTRVTFKELRMHVYASWLSIIYNRSWINHRQNWTGYCLQTQYRSISTTSLFRELSPHGELSSITWWTPVHNGRICASRKNIISMWKLHIDCFQHCTCFVETLLKIAYKRTLNYMYMYMLFVLRPIISVIVD